MIQRLGARFNDWFRRFMPDPFIFALLLTLLTIALALAFTGRSLWDVLLFWRGAEWKQGAPGAALGFWGLLEFAMQMVLILVTGHALASAPAVKRGIEKLASRPTTTGGAAALVSFCAMVAALLNWGFGLIVGALLAREVARSGRERGLKFHYPLLGAADYMSLMIWHGGLSGSAPLDAAATGVAPVQRTLLSAQNIVLTVALLATVPLIFRLLAPRGGESVVEIAPGPPPPPPPERGMWIEEAPVLTLLFCAMAAFGLVMGVRQGGLTFVNLYSVPFLFLFAGLLLHWRPIAYARAVDEGVRGAGGIILQFPFYAAIVGLLVGSGLDKALAGWCRDAARSTGLPFPLLVFLSACAVNNFIPSGGGQWRVQSPVVLPAGAELGVPPERIVMAVAYGDQLTNMIQPFWALALLGITGLKARDIMGYTALVMLLVSPIYIFALLIF